MKFRLRQRIAALAVLCLVPVVAVSSVALVQLAAQYLTDEAEMDAARLAGTAVQATRLAMLSGDSALVARLFDALARQEGVRFLRLYDADGFLKAPAGEGTRRLDLASRQCTACHPDPRLAPRPPGECAHWSGSEFNLHYPVKNEPACGACHPPPEFQRLLGFVEVGVDATKIHSRIGELWRRAALWGGVVLAAAALPLLFGLGWAVERPMGECLRMVREVSRNNLAVRSPVTRTDEWGELLDSLNSMVAALQGARVTLEALNRDLEGQVIQRTRELEEALSRAQESDRMKTEFLANLSHEFSTPLQGVIGYAQLLLDEIDGAVTEAQRLDLDVILRNGRRLLEWSEDLLELARLEANRRYLCVDRVRVRDLLQEVAESARGQVGRKPVEVKPAVADGCPDAWGDVAALRRALLHVVDNAVRHAQSGTVSVVARGDGAGGLEIRVTDTGPGMEAAVVEAALRGFGSKGGGGGLAVGLSMSRRLVEIHGGTFSVQSRVGEGTEVTLRLPGAPAVSAGQA